MLQHTKVLHRDSNIRFMFHFKCLPSVRSCIHWTIQLRKLTTKFGVNKLGKLHMETYLIGDRWKNC